MQEITIYETSTDWGDKPADEANQMVSNRHSDGCEYLK